MSSREIIILILGLAIVGVVLRGLFVALRARKGQIRLAIDKNIPKDVDLEALELAELPGGGARVVKRSLDTVNNQNTRLDAALKKAEDLQLGSEGSDDDDVPILMDAVSLSKAPQAEKEIVAPAETRLAEETATDEDASEDELSGQTSEQFYEERFDTDAESEIDFDEGERQFEPQLGEVSEESTFDDPNDDDPNDDETADGEEAIWENHAPEDESADDVLLDYEDYGDDDDEAIDSMASVAPDYQSDSDSETDSIEDEHFADEIEETEVEEIDDTEVDDLEDRYDDDAAGEIANEDAADTNDIQVKSFEDELDDFSLSAGERIGFSGSKQPPAPRPNLEAASQSSLFDEEADDIKPVEPEQSKPMSFFSALKRSITPQEKPKLKAAEQVTMQAPAVDAIDEVIVKPESPIPTTVSPKQAEGPQERPRAETPTEAPISSRAQSEYKAGAPSEPSEVLVMNVMAREGFAFAGDDLLQVLITSGLKFGEMNIFHQRVGADKKGPVLFSVANVLNPGTFDLNNMDNFTTLGVSFFLALPTVMNNLEAFEKMLAVAQQVKSGLGGELKDDNRNVMTSQTIEHYRQRVRDFELRRLKAAGARH